VKLSTPCKYIDLFAGCGGISLGLYNAGWRGIFAIEKNKMAFRTLKHNLIEKKNHFDWPPWLPVTEHDIVDVLRDYRCEIEKLRGTVDLVAGGPPCQGFSLAGRRNEDDERNRLVDSYVEFVSLVRPQCLFFENVRGFTIGFKKGYCRSEAYSDGVSRKLRNLGYKVEGNIIDFSDFGVPQRRKRYILVGMLEEEPDLFFEELMKIREGFINSKGLEIKSPLWKAISDLERVHGEVESEEFRTFKLGIYGRSESTYQKLMRKGWSEEHPDSHRFANHKKETAERFEYILKNCRRNRVIGEDVKKKFNLRKKSITPLDWSSCCPTLTTLPDDYIHYSEPRILTVREYARIQSFNDWFEFTGKYTTGGERRRMEVPRYSQVGNAVPPIFAELSGTVLKAIV
jgi:DNA (cytosine-5)-methyltransferase 1